MGKRVLRTELCDLLGIEYPILSAGMGPTLIGEETGAPVELVVAVSEAGGCGVLGASMLTIDQLRDQIREIRSLTDKPFGIDLLLPLSVDELPKGMPERIPLSELLMTLPQPYQDWIKKVREDMELPDAEVIVKTTTTTFLPDEAIDVCIEEKIPLFCAGLGNPASMVERAHAVGMKVLGIAGRTRHAVKMIPGGLDILVAQGYEGGGHTGTVGTLALLPQILDVAGGSLPIVAAGGIGDGRGLAACLALGCAGAWVGTRFLATNEGGALDVNKQRIIDSDDQGTKVSRAYTGKTLRASLNRFHDLWDGSGLKPLPFPTQVFVSSALLAAFIEANKVDYVGGLAGQISGLVNEIKPAGQVLEEMVEEAADILTRKLPERVIVK